MIGGSSFLGRNVISQLPKSVNIVATYNTSISFKEFCKKRNNVKPLKLDLTKEINVNFDEQFDFVLYMSGVSPFKDKGKKVDGLNMMEFLHAKAILIILRKVKNFGKFIYFSSGICYLSNNFSNYRKSRLLGESIIKSESKFHNFDYIVVRNMEIYGRYMPEHKIYRKICNWALSKKTSININGDGKNLIDTMYIDDYVEIIIKLLNSNLRNLTVDVCKSMPVSINTLIITIYNILGLDSPEINYIGTPTENTDFVLDNKDMIDLLGYQPRISLEEGLKKWINEGLK